MTDRPNEKANTEDFEFAALNEAENYRRALVKEFSPYLKGRVIEIGAGIGQMTEVFLKLPGIDFLQSVEPDQRFCKQFRSKYPSRPLIQGTIGDVPADSWNGIVSINVLEHIKDDQEELARYAKVLSPEQGLLCLFVPARQELYAPIEMDFGHFRRYGKKELLIKLGSAGFDIVSWRYYNFTGYFAWLLTFTLLKRRHFNPRAVRFYDRAIFPTINFIETHVSKPPFGQSLLVVARAKQK